MSTPTPAQIQRIAEYLSVAYWRGRLDPFNTSTSAPMREAIAAAAREDAINWRDSARAALTGMNE